MSAPDQSPLALTHRFARQKMTTSGVVDQADAHAQFEAVELRRFPRSIRHLFGTRLTGLQNRPILEGIEVKRG